MKAHEGLQTIGVLSTVGVERLKQRIRELLPGLAW